MTQTWQVYKDIEINGQLKFFDVHFEGNKSACEKFIKTHGRNSNWHLGYDITADELNWFDQYGNLTREIPQECIADCSSSGDVTESVKQWVLDLEFSVTSLDQARKYLQEFGAWDDLDRQGSFALSQKVLWLACCEIKESGEWFGLTHQIIGRNLTIK